MTVLLIPAAGAGSRFAAAGYTEPKPFIRPKHQPYCLLESTVKDVIQCLEEIPSQIVILVRAENVERTKALFPTADVVSVPELTDGAASTIELAESVIRNPREPILVSNCDQTVRMDSNTRDTFRALRQACACVPFCFTSDGDSKWSYFTGNAFQPIVEKPAAEFVPSDKAATCGLYWFDDASEMFRAIRAMKRAHFRVNGEYYFAPCINFLASYGPPTIPIFVDDFHGLGTPEDLTHYEDCLAYGG